MTTELHRTTAPLGALSIDPVNIRKTDVVPSADFIESIRHKGVIEALIVRPAPSGGWYVTNGGMRLRALLALAGEGAIGSDHPVPIDIRAESDLEARDTSLATAVVRREIHPVDLYEAVAELVAQGLGAGEMAKRYGVATRDIAQVLALAKLSPKVRQAWRDGRLEEGAAQAFTLQPDHGEQDKVLAKRLKDLKSWGRANDVIQEHEVRNAIVGNKGHAKGEYRFVGAEAYEAAGGKVTRDLFGDNDLIDNPALAKKLADKKLKEKCQEFVAQGWAWASPIGDLPPGASYGWGKLAGGAKASAADRAKSGVIVQIKHDGTLECSYAVMKPDVAKREKARSAKATGDGKAAAPKKAPAISNALMTRLSEQLTRAAAKVLRHEHDLALAALIAGFQSEDDAVSVRESGLDDMRDRRPGRGFRQLLSFEKVLGGILATNQQTRIAILAGIAAIALNFRTFNAVSPPLKDPSCAALLAAMPAAKLKSALAEYFDANDYFAGVSKELCLSAITEAIGADESRRIASKPKKTVADFAMANVPKTGWLPKELRWSGYDGPGAAKPKVVKGAKLHDPREAKAKPAKAKAKAKPAKPVKAAAAKKPQRAKPAKAAPAEASAS